MRTGPIAVALAVAAGFLWSAPVHAVPCGGPFNGWVESFKRKAAAAGVSQRGIAALNGVQHQPRVVSLDRGQRRTFGQSFEKFVSTRVTSASIAQGRARMQRHAALLSRIEKQFGVPPEIVVAIWGLETSFGANMGNHPALPALATLAHDCRRTEMFQRELMAALQIIDRGDKSASDMRGAWAGELGQTQFLPSSYMRFAIDYDGDGRRDLIRSVPDALASTANYLRGHGWQAGGSYSEGSRNFAVLREWNRSQNYQRTIVLFASRLKGG